MLISLPNIPRCVGVSFALRGAHGLQMHLWMDLARNVLFAGGIEVSQFSLSNVPSKLEYQLVKARQDRDDDIASLMQTMQNTYSSVVGSGHLQNERSWVALNRILKQTVACGFFLQEYTRGRTSAGW